MRNLATKGTILKIGYGLYAKTERSRDFAIELQKREAEIFDNLYPSIKDQGLFCLTKHDSLIVKRKDQDLVLRVMKAYFNEIGFEYMTNVEGTTFRL